jgi:hypothetical protein
MTEKVFTPDEVVNLDKHQHQSRYHPFTCPNHNDDDHRQSLDCLIPTVRGWVCQFCDYTQNWAHETMKGEQK